MKNPLTPAGIEPATFRFVTQHLNHCATAVPEEIGNTNQIGFRTPQSVVDTLCTTMFKTQKPSFSTHYMHIFRPLFTINNSYFLTDNPPIVNLTERTVFSER